MHDIKVSNPKMTVYSSFFISITCFFSENCSKSIYYALFWFSTKFPFKWGVIFWNLDRGVIFWVPQSGKIGNTGEFLLFWNGHPSVLGRVLGPLSEKPKMVSRYKFFYGTLLESLAYYLSHIIKFCWWRHDRNYRVTAFISRYLYFEKA